MEVEVTWEEKCRELTVRLKETERHNAILRMENLELKNINQGLKWRMEELKEAEEIIQQACKRLGDLR